MKIPEKQKQKLQAILSEDCGLRTTSQQAQEYGEMMLQLTGVVLKKHIRKSLQAHKS